MNAVFPPIQELIPHRGTLLMLDRVIASDAESLTAVRTVPTGDWTLDEEGNMPSWIGIELMAQAIAAHVSLQAMTQGLAPKRGVLLGTRALKTEQSAYAPGTVLKVKVQQVFQDESGLAAYDCSITADLGVAATATLKVYEPADFDAFVQGKQT